jgi:hypothetical protein
MSLSWVQCRAGLTTTGQTVAFHILSLQHWIRLVHECYDHPDYRYLHVWLTPPKHYTQVTPKPPVETDFSPLHLVAFGRTGVHCDPISELHFSLWSVSPVVRRARRPERSLDACDPWTTQAHDHNLRSITERLYPWIPKRPCFCQERTQGKTSC